MTIFEAVQKGNLEDLKRTIEAQGNVNMAIVSPLLLAIENDNLKTAMELLNHGASVDAEKKMKTFKPHCIWSQKNSSSK